MKLADAVLMVAAIIHYKENILTDESGPLASSCVTLEFIQEEIGLQGGQTGSWWAFLPDFKMCKE